MVNETDLKSQSNTKNTKSYNSCEEVLCVNIFKQSSSSAFLLGQQYYPSQSNLVLFMIVSKT